MVQLRSNTPQTNFNESLDDDNLVLSKSSPMALMALFAISLISFLLSMYYLLFVNRIDSNWSQVMFSAFIVWTVIYLFSTRSAKKSYFLISSALILALSVFHISHVGLQALGVYDFALLKDVEMGIWYQRAGWLFMLSVSSFGIGMSFTGGVTVYDSKKLYETESAQLGRSMCWWYGVGLFMASMLALLMLFYTVGNIFVYSRSEIFGGVGDTRGFGLFQMFFPSSMILLMLGASTKKQRYATYILLIVFGLGILLMGYRSLVMFPILIGTILWVKAGRDLNKTVIVPGLIFLIIAIPTVRYLRTLGSYDSLSSTDVSSSLDQAKIDDIFIELGTTSNIVAYVLKWVPEEEDYRYGYTYWLSIKNTLPNIGSDISSSSRSIIKDSSVDITKLSASDWFIYRFNKWMFDTGGGSGFSMIAEPYLNFGLPGVIVFFILLGFIIGKLDSISLLHRPTVLLLSAAIMWPLIKGVRNDFTTFLKPASFILIVFLIWKLSTFWKKYKASKKLKNTDGRIEL